MKYQNQSSANASVSSADDVVASYSKLAMNRWLQVSLPLTAVTLVAAYLFYLFAKSRMMLRIQNVLDEQGLV